MEFILEGRVEQQLLFPTRLLHGCSFHLASKMVLLTYSGCHGGPGHDHVCLWARVLRPWKTEEMILLQFSGQGFKKGKGQSHQVDKESKCQRFKKGRVRSRERRSGPRREGHGFKSWCMVTYLAREHVEMSFRVEIHGDHLRMLDRHAIYNICSSSIRKILNDFWSNHSDKTLYSTVELLRGKIMVDLDYDIIMLEFKTSRFMQVQ
ncbi:hypothetical protein RRG08_009533 [Elysia crispata]|uniref:Uncharacterized protein n=1 Tax=Elysia crispata TaxID=231223 RepID=A0AAE1E8I7_9GAST|nr:hypothetical protein RRG08_009533 [Elysia crispata]